MSLNNQVSNGLDRSFTNVVLEPGSLVVVTGVNGNISSHVADQLLKHGYRVRGTVRDISKSQWLVDLFDTKYGSGKIELIRVADMAALNAFDEAVKGAAGFIHTATPVMETADPDIGVSTVVKGTLNFLESAAKESGMKRVVLTSSSGACTAPIPNKVFSIDSSTWNEASVSAAFAPGPKGGLQRKLDVYYASKTKGEQAAWAWMKEHKPSFVLNTVLPNANFGPAISPEHQGYHSTLAWIRSLWDGFEGEEELKDQPPQYYIDIRDNAAVHVAALVYNDVKNERLFTWAYPYNWNDILAIFRKLYPDVKFIEDIANLGRDLSHVTNERAEELLKRIEAKPHWTSLEDTISDAVKQYA